jgi:hypothetical protein
MLTSRRGLFFGALAVLAAVVLFTALGFHEASDLRERARRLQKATNELIVGRSTLADVRAVGQRFQAIVSSGTCTAGECRLEMLVSNAALPRFWRGPETRFVVDLLVRNDVLVERAASFYLGLGAGRSLVSVTESVPQVKGPQRYPRVHALWSGDNVKWRYLVELTPAVPMDSRMRYSGFDFRCLSRFRGCRDAQQLLPYADWGSPPVNAQ